MGFFGDIGRNVDRSIGGIGRSIHNAGQGMQSFAHGVGRSFNSWGQSMGHSFTGAYNSSTHDMINRWNTSRHDIKEQVAKEHDRLIGAPGQSDPGQISSEYQSAVIGGVKPGFDESPGFVAIMLGGLHAAESNPGHSHFNQGIHPLHLMCRQIVGGIRGGDIRMRDHDWNLFMPMLLRGSFLEKQRFSDTPYQQVKGSECTWIRMALEDTRDEALSGTPAFEGAVEDCSIHAEPIRELLL